MLRPTKGRLIRKSMASTPAAIRPIAAIAMVSIRLCAATKSFDQTHAEFDRFLRLNVTNGTVHYAAIKARPADIDVYLETLASVQEIEFKSWTTPDQIAFLCNAYNAATLRLVASKYPLRSIKDIGGLTTGPWDLPCVRLFGKTLSLNEVEHGRLRRDYADPRVHFALVCAAKGCPPLRSEAYRGLALDQQFDDQARLFFAETSKNHIDSGTRTLFLSPIMKWYAADFEKASGGVTAFIHRYLPAGSPSKPVLEHYTIRYTTYDWSLNDAPR
jgi:Protein of unknown function, DUF547